MHRLYQILLGPVRPVGGSTEWFFTVYQHGSKTLLSYETQRLALTARDTMLAASNAIGIDSVEFEDALTNFLAER